LPILVLLLKFKLLLLVNNYSTFVRGSRRSCFTSGSINSATATAAVAVGIRRRRPLNGETVEALRSAGTAAIFTERHNETGRVVEYERLPDIPVEAVCMGNPVDYDVDLKGLLVTKYQRLVLL
jgi:hypothetical protein